jgi:ubiquinone/menaquinone biosynthesis C-methylase UbiE
MKIVRLHDTLYLKENRYKKPKECFKMLIRLLKKKINKKIKYKLIDIGCANGELIFNLEKNFKNVEITGLDIRKDLINKAKKNVSRNINFIRKDISNKKFKLKNKYDIIIFSGVLAIFDNPNLVLKNLLKVLKPKGTIYIFDIFNMFDYNIYTKYEDIKMKKKVLQSGWNMLSLNFIKKFFKNKKVEFFKFNINKKIKKNKSDPLRTWTIKFQKKNYFTNALNFIYHQYWIRIS